MGQSLRKWVFGACCWPSKPILTDVTPRHGRFFCRSNVCHTRYQPALEMGWSPLSDWRLGFAALALGSFDTADWPSHAVAVYNAPSANLGGAMGALLAYWSYHLIGLASWIVLLALGAMAGA